MYTQLLDTDYQAFRRKWGQEDVKMMFFKCMRWQVEETMDPINCPYHYYCESVHSGKYHPAIDIAVFAYTTSTYLASLVIVALDITRSSQSSLDQRRRFFIPSGPVSLPVFLFVFAKGHGINNLFPLSQVGPAILQLVYISALTYDNGEDNYVKYVFFEASTISGILHASLSLDSIILPYYTGFDALISSTFSGECSSCVCRKDALLVGGKLVSYRGWSWTTFAVVIVLCLRIFCRLSGRKSGELMLLRFLLESSCWLLILHDCIYLTTNSPPENLTLRTAAFGGVFVLISLHFLKWICTRIRQWNSMIFTANKIETI